MKKKAKRKRAKNMAELTKNHEAFIKGKKAHDKGLPIFNTVLKISTLKK